MDSVRINHIVASINNAAIEGKIAKQEQDVPRMLQDVFEKTLTLEAG